MGPLKICLRPDPRGVFKPAKFKKNAKTKYAFCRGKTPFGDRSEMIQGRHQLEDVHSVEVKRLRRRYQLGNVHFPEAICQPEETSIAPSNRTTAKAQVAGSCFYVGGVTKTSLSEHSAEIKRMVHDFPRQQ